MANVELLKKIRDIITSKPGSWDQNWWMLVPAADQVPTLGTDTQGKEVSCGTTMCLAGWACFLSGLKGSLEQAEQTHGGISLAYVEDGRSIEGAAQDLLDIDEDTAFTLFHSYGREQALGYLTELIETGSISDY